ncbi:hypothetical protein [Streptomyces sp. NPDC045714]|uniref:hypothetical protein n=1 Tax=Streptomyces sp. NPDC045714 TaxID=3154913 RepID=UPI0033C8BAF3
MGVARAVTNIGQVGLLDKKALSLPWARGDRSLWITVVPTRITGRRIAARDTRFSSIVTGPEGR